VPTARSGSAGALAAGIVVVPLLAIGPDYLPRLFPPAWRQTVIEIIGWAYYPGLAIGMILLLTTLYKVAPKRKHRWNRGLPGAFLAAAVFLVASGGQRFYLTYVYSHPPCPIGRPRLPDRGRAAPVRSEDG